MKKYDVYFFSEDKGSKDIRRIEAESHEEAFQQYLIGKTSNDFKLVVVDVAGFFDSLTSSAQTFKNPLYKDVDESGSKVDAVELNLDLLNEDLSKVPSNAENPQNKQYKVMTQKDKWFSQKFDPERFEQALNAYAKEGWIVKSICTASIPGFGGNREEIIVVFER